MKDERVNPTGSVKDRTAAAMMRRAWSSGELNGIRGVVESTSGNMGAALARAALESGLPFVAVTDPNLSPQLAAKIHRYGGRILEVVSANTAESYLGARLAVAREMADDGWFWTRQYSNPAAIEAHVEGTAPEMDRQLPAQVDALLVAVSTCGTLSGLGTYFRTARPDLRIVAVDVEGSAVFGGAPQSRRITGIGAARAPEFPLSELVDEVIIVSEADAIFACRRLARAGLGVGGSTGAVFDAFRQLAVRSSRPLTAACVIADGSENYLSTIYSDAWISSALGEENARRATGAGNTDVVVARSLA